MTNKLIQTLAGLNISSLVRGLRLGPGEIGRASRASHSAAHPMEERAEVERDRTRELLSTIPIIGVAELVGALLGERRSVVKIDLLKQEDGRLPLHDALALLSVLMAETPREVLEIGTFMGHTTRTMAENLPTAIIHTVDLPLEFAQPVNPAGEIPKDDFHLIRNRVVGREFKGKPEGERIRQHFGDTATIDFKEFGRPTFFFIDGSHTYEYCRQDSEKCLALGGGKGTFLWHDCDEYHPGVVKCLAEWRAAGKDIFRIYGTAMGYWKSRG